MGDARRTKGGTFRQQEATASRRRRLPDAPAGTVRIRVGRTQTTVGVLPIEGDWDSPTARQSVAARLLLVDALASIEQGLPVPKAHLAALELAFLDAFGVGIKDLWIPTYVRYLERA